jgi:Transposase domain (DUF772)
LLIPCAASQRRGQERCADRTGCKKRCSQWPSWRTSCRPTYPLRAIRTLVNEALTGLNGLFNTIYADGGRASIAPEKLLRAMLIQVFFSVRSERQLMEHIRYNLLYRWFVGLAIDDEVWDHPGADWKGKPRSNDTHASTTDSDARLFRKGKGQAAVQGYQGHVLESDRIRPFCQGLICRSTSVRQARCAFWARCDGSLRCSCGMLISIRAIRTMLLAIMVSLKCWSDGH